jgi:hypothetical protein
VSPGARTFYVTAQRFNGSAAITAINAFLSVEFYPDAVGSVVSPEPGLAPANAQGSTPAGQH